MSSGPQPAAVARVEHIGAASVDALFLGAAEPVSLNRNDFS